MKFSSLEVKFPCIDGEFSCTEVVVFWASMLGEPGFSSFSQELGLAPRCGVLLREMGGHAPGPYGFSNPKIYPLT